MEDQDIVDILEWWLRHSYHHGSADSISVSMRSRRDSLGSQIDLILHASRIYYSYHNYHIWLNNTIHLLKLEPIQESSSCKRQKYCEIISEWWMLLRSHNKQYDLYSLYASICRCYQSLYPAISSILSGSICWYRYMVRGTNHSKLYTREYL